MYSKQKQVLCWGIIICSSLFIGMFDVSNSGVQWSEDGSRYLNNAAMIRDYLVSGDWFSPYEFAKKNYKQYPAFSIPYHPPGYALLLACWFLIFGMSFATARCFIALLLGIMGCLFFDILRKQGIIKRHALFVALILISSYEIVRWGRSTMSEIPALTFSMIGSYFFINWVNEDKIKWCLLAFLFASIAFFCKVTSAGIIPGWVLYCLFLKGLRKIFSIVLILCSSIYLFIGVIWTKFVSKFAHHEMRSNLPVYIERIGSWDNFALWINALPALVGIFFIAFAIIGIVIALINKKNNLLIFWLFWFVSYYLFQVVTFSHFESRYGIFAIPAIIALVSGIVTSSKNGHIQMKLSYAVFFFLLLTNIYYARQLPKGMAIGHNSVAKTLSQLKQPGNILMSCWNDADLIFRFRCYEQPHKRQMIRGDRTVVIRNASYSGIKSVVLVNDKAGFLDILQKGRIRYILTCSSRESNYDDRPKDMVLIHKWVSSDPALFKFLKKFELNFYHNTHRLAEIYLWIYSENLPTGSSQLPIIIPTSKIRFK